MPFLPRRLTILAALTAISLSVTGCSLQTTDTTPAEPVTLTLPAIQGSIMGGETPVAGSNIILWETDPANGGYASNAAVKLGTVTGSSPGGNFLFTTGYTCSAGSFVYVTSTGGDITNGGSFTINNNNLVLMAALGSCSNFATAAAQAKVNILINELSTVAAAYALDGFMTVAPGTTGKQLVYVGAPGRNNAATGACTGTGPAMSCVSAGLSHAFANAANLVDAVRFDGSHPTGNALITVPGNVSSSVPTAVINTLGNIMQFCTNSAGGAAGDGSNCGLLFTDSSTTATTASVPTDTLTAFMNIAKQPYNNVGTTCTGTPATTGGLYCLAGTFASFNPSLSAVPHDWSIAIAYSGTVQAFPITNYADAGGTATFTAANNFTAGQTVTLSAFPTSTFLNSQTVTVLSTGLSGTQFEATVTDPASAITAYSITSNVATFTASNNFAAGESVALAGFPTSTFFNGTNVTVLAAGLSSTQFEASFSHVNVATTTESGTATPNPNTAAEAGTATLNGGFGSPQYLTLDANDNVYIDTGNAYTSTQGGLAAMTSTGAALWTNAINTTNCVAGAIATDAIGNVWLSVDAVSTSACSYAIYGYSAATGAAEYSFQPGSGTVCNTTTPSSTNCPGFTAYDTTHAIQSTPKAIAFDRLNNLWYSRSSSSCSSCIFELPYTAGTGSALGTYGGPTNTQNAAIGVNQMFFDSNQNLWVGNQSSTSGTAGKLYEVYNTNTAAAPTYTVTSGFDTVTLPTYDNGGIGMDSAGNIWSGSSLNILEYTPTGTGATSSFGTAVLDQTITGTHPYISQVDGGGIFFTPSITSSGSIFIQNTPVSAIYNATTASKNSVVVRPCYVPSDASTCDVALGSSLYISGDIKAVQVDSAGAVWTASGVSSTAASGFVVQILGVGNPTWPSYAYDVPGAKPQ